MEITQKDLIQEQDRVSGLLEDYEEIHRQIEAMKDKLGVFGIDIMKRLLKKAGEALASGDAVKISTAYRDLKAIE